MKEPLRKILHIDMDCFYAAVEILDNPQLQGKPVAVGGRQQSRRGVLCTCNYEARRFGVRSAMPSNQALELCPQLILLPVRMERYQTVSSQIHQIFQRYTSMIEPLSLDEAYLDVSEVPLFDNSATRMGQAIQQDIRQELGLSASVGVAPNKFLAKVASDWKKPGGLFTLQPDMIPAFIQNLPIGHIPGIGKVSQKKLHQDGFHTCGDLQTQSLTQMIQKWGNWGHRLFHLCRGMDLSPVRSHRIRKSLSVEDTFEYNLQGADQCLPALQKVYEHFLQRLSKHRQQHPQQPPDIQGRFHLFVKIKYANFRQTTIERSMNQLDFQTFQNLFLERYGKYPQAVRLLGLGIRLPEPEDLLQIEMPLDTKSRESVENQD